MEIQTERLLLRDFVAGDWPAVMAYQVQPEYLRYYAWTDRTETEVQAFVQRFIQYQRARPRIKFQLAITLPQTGTVIGSCGVRKDNHLVTTADMGYELDPAHWGQGYATEAACAMLNFGFSTLKLERIWATCVVENVASARVLEKVGLQLEDRLVKHEWFKDRWWDTFQYGISRAIWETRRSIFEYE